MVLLFLINNVLLFNRVNLYKFKEIRLENIMTDLNYTWLNHEDVKLLQFKNLLKYSDIVTHCFTTRIGGISSGECTSLNLGFNRNDTRENVIENYNRVCNALGIKIEDMVLSRQVHDDKVYRISSKDKGKGIFFENDLLGYDGLITNEVGVAIVTFYADCVPIFFLDPVNKAIGVTHSGWRGTKKQIAARTIEALKKEFNSNCENLICAIGPSARQCCYEVGEEVYEEFLTYLPMSKDFMVSDAGKWKLDLQGIIKRTLLDNGIKHENLTDSMLCTMCHKETFFSHRGDKGKTGSLAGIMQLV